MLRIRHRHIALPLICTLVVGAFVGPAAMAISDTLLASNTERPGVYAPAQSASFQVAGDYLVVPDSSLCPPSVQAQMQASGAWTALDLREAYKYAAVTRTYFLPELTWTPILARIEKPTFEESVKVGDRYIDNQWKCRVKATDSYTSSINERIPSERATAFIAHRTSAIPQAGVIVLERQNHCTRGFQCTIKVADKTYNLRDKSVRRKLACESYPSGNAVMPTSSFEYPFHYTEVERGYPYKSDYSGPVFMMGTPWHADLSWWSIFLGDMDVCLPVPNKQGEYQIEITRKAPTETIPASPAAWRCRNFTGTVYCSYGSTPAQSYNPSSKVTLQMRVGKKNVNIAPLKCQGQCRNENWVGQ